MKAEDLDIEHVLARADKVVELLEQVVDLLELNGEKTQELLERVECIDNTLDDMKGDETILLGLQEFQRQFLRRS